MKLNYDLIRDLLLQIEADFRIGYINFLRNYFFVKLSQKVDKAVIDLSFKIFILIDWSLLRLT